MPARAATNIQNSPFRHLDRSAFDSQPLFELGKIAARIGASADKTIFSFNNLAGRGLIQKLREQLSTVSVICAIHISHPDPPYRIEGPYTRSSGFLLETIFNKLQFNHD